MTLQFEYFLLFYNKKIICCNIFNKAQERKG
nr:MAG TPA: hypothetical protein [Caudoviricetes sp.]